MAIEFEQSELTELTPKIAVIGVGGAGCNAVSNMISADLQGVDFVVANTDAQSLLSVSAHTRIQLGREITQGLGAGAQPRIGEAAAQESSDAIDAALDGAHMAFITAGMGGGTGTGASPVIAAQARERGILTVGVVTKPFSFEGGRRMKIADAGIKELAQHVDTLIIIPNQNLFNVANERTTFAEAFQLADDVLHSGVRSITDLMVMPGLINLDFADVRTVMSEMGKAMMGTGEAEGESRAREAAEKAISNQLLEDASLKGARGVIINVTGGMDMTLYEVDEAVNLVRALADEDALIVFGSAYNDELEGKIRVSVVATGIEGGPAPIRAPLPEQEEVSERFITQNSTNEAEAESVVAEAEEASEQSEDQIAQEETTAAAQVTLLDEEAVSSDDVEEPHELEEKALESVADDEFVAEAPMAPPQELMNAGDTQTPSPADPEREEQYLSGGEEEAQDDRQEDTPTQRSFFQKVTQRFKEERHSGATIVDRMEGANDSGGRKSSTGLGGVSSEDRPAPETKKEGRDQMEIPAFLRRQQN